MLELQYYKYSVLNIVYGELSGLHKSYIGNIQQWSWSSLNSDTDEGEVVSVTYIKRYSDTALRLTANWAHRTRKDGNGYRTKW